MIECKELTRFDEFRECAKIQKDIFGVSDIDAISPLTLTVFAKKFPQIGIVIGAIDKNEENEKLVGFAFYTAVLQENAYYGVASGLLPGYRDKNIGTNLNKKIRELAIARKVQYLFGSFDPLEGNLGHTYFNKLGFWGVKYQETPYKLSNEVKSINAIPIDKVIFKWEFESQRVNKRIAGAFSPQKFEDVLSKYPIINETHFIDSKSVLVEVPGDFISLKKSHFDVALKWRLNTRKVFNEYINKRGYWITEFYSQIENTTRRNFYLLEKK